MSCRFTSYLWATAAACGLIGTTQAEAQTAPPPSTDRTSADAEVPGDIIVTATRREQALQDVPIAVTALGGDALASARVNSTADLMQQVPNLNITSQVGAMVVYLRGVGQLSTNPGQEPSVATYVDGVYQPTVFGALMSLSNVERVEVIKGPQGTLFGRNATGGLINVVTRDPSQELEANLLVSHGNYETVKLAGYVAGGVAPNIAADLSIYYYNQDEGVGRNVTTDRRLDGTRNFNIRSKVVVDATETTRIRLTGDYSSNRSSVGNNLAILPGSTGFGAAALPGFYDVQNSVDPLNKNRTWQISGRIDQEFEPFDVVSITSYTHNKDREIEDADSAPAPILNAIFSQRTRIFTQELQLVSKKGSALTWIVGAYYFNSLAKGTPTGIGLYGLAFGGGGVQSRGSLKTKSIAVFGEATYEILPKLNLTLGGRYTSDRKVLSGFTDSVDANGAVVATVPIPGAKETFKKPTYRAILDYHFTDDVMGYLSYSRGFKSGGFDTAFPTGIAVKPEVLDAIEAGLKMELFDRRLKFNVAAFHYDYKDLQLPILVPPASQITVNAANSKVDGVDLDGSFTFLENLYVNFGFGYLDSRYSDFTQAPCVVRNPDGSTSGFVCDVSGNTLIHAPKTTYNIGGTYSLPTTVGDFTLTASYSRQAKSFFDVDNRLFQPAYGLLNGQLGWTSGNGQFSVIGYVENLTNKKYTIAQYVQAGFPDRYVAGKPRMYGVELRGKF